MKKVLYLLFTCVFCIALSGAASAAEDESPQPRKRARSLLGTPVNVNIAGAGSLPEGMALTMINASFADKTNSKKGGGDGPDVFNQTWLLKMRYGITNHLEIATTLPYINNSRSGHANGSDHIEGFGDQVVQMTIAPLNLHQGDPVALSLTLGVSLPTGNYGKNHLPGNGVWGGRAAAAIGTWFTKDIKVDTEVVWTGPFERGNQKVKRGDQYQWNVNARYLFDWWDIGLESTLIKSESGDRKLANGDKRSSKNGLTEWYVGPSMNFAWDATGMWAGIGVFLPVMQDAKGPMKVEDARYEFKIGKVW